LPLFSLKIPAKPKSQWLCAYFTKALALFLAFDQFLLEISPNTSGGFCENRQKSPV
jgi:hypothetical protein